MTNTKNTFTMNTTNNDDRFANELFDFTEFCQALTQSEGNKLEGLSFMGELANFFYWQDIEIYKDDPESVFLRNHLVDALEEREYIKNRQNVFLLKAIRSITTLNSRYKKQTGKRFILVKISKEDGIWNRNEVLELLEAFEDLFNEVWNREALPNRNFRDLQWMKTYSAIEKG